MYKLIFVLAACGFAYSTDAQPFHRIEHLNGAKNIAGNLVTVTPLGEPSELKWRDVSPYWIGNKNIANGYCFSFARPVKGIKLSISAINADEVITIKVNGRRYTVSASQLQPVNDMKNLTQAIADDGVIKMDALTGTSATLVSIKPAAPVSTIEIHHENGKANGSVFSIAYTEDENAFANNDNITATSLVADAGHEGRIIIYPEPNHGNFTIEMPKKVDFEVNIVNTAGVSVYSSAIKNESYKQVQLDAQLPAGNYIVQILTEGIQHVDKITLLK
jgi:hypothetical protein